MISCWVQHDRSFATHLDSGELKLRMSSQPVQYGAYIAQQPERSDANGMQSPTSNANINLSPLSNNNSVYKHHLLFSTGQDCPALLH